MNNAPARLCTAGRRPNTQPGEEETMGKAKIAPERAA